MTAQRDETLYFDWLHDDTEEDLVGADWHQDAIRALSTSLQMLRPERGWPWHIGDQLTLIGDVPERKDWRPEPDISIHPTLGPQKRRHIDVRVEGPPAVVIEVASASTWTYDVSLESTRRGKRQAGKAYGYLVLLRLPAYLVFDPYDEYVRGQFRAWRRAGDLLQEWRPEADGRYHSPELGIAFGADGPLLRVFDPEGQPVPYWFEAPQRIAALEQARAEQAREMAALEQAHAEQARQIADLRAELDQLRQGRDRP